MTTLRADTECVDAVVVGAGHHGLVAAATLADAGWDVLVLEARDKIGGAVASRNVDGWVMDEYSACHPLAAASPVLRGLDLSAYGLRWAQADVQVAHVASGDLTTAPAVFRDPERTAASLAADHPQDGWTYLRLVEHYQSIKGPFLDALLTRWPPIVPAARLAASVGMGLPDLARFLLLPVTRMGEELFRGDGGRLLLAGNAMHADVPPTASVSGVFGWLMTMLAQDPGFVAPVGGAQFLADALRRRAEAAGARIETSQPVGRIVVRGGAAYGVQTVGGRRVRARRAVIADTSAPDLYQRLLPASAIPPGLRDRLDRFQWDLPTVKLNYRLTGAMPWIADQARGAAVVHAGADVTGLLRWFSDLETDTVPRHPFALVGQMSSIDATRSPVGTETLWVYSHLPRRVTDQTAALTLVDRLEGMLDDLAPGWRDLVIDRWEQTPAALHQSNPNLGEGAVGGGTQQLFQQALWRPVTGLGGPRTHLAGLYLGSAAVHPGGGVHGACGYLAARAALADSAWWGRPLAKVATATLHRLYDRRAPDALPWTAPTRAQLGPRD